MTLEQLEERTQSVPGKLLLEGDNTCDYFEWLDLTDALTAAMRNPDGYWFATVSDFGWRKLSGHKLFRAADGRELLAAILPRTECSFKIHRCGRRGLAIQNSHHDSPCGTEWYYLLPISGTTYHRLK